MKDKDFMRLALWEGYRRKGHTLPNPAVGAVLVKNGKVIARAHHYGAGHSHAESLAIDKAGREAKGATLYVTLQPCNHYGRTPPCTEKIIKAGIKRVVIGVEDPNPKAQGGIEKLKRAGIEVKLGVLKKECWELIDDFYFLIKTGRSFIHLKLALTLDGALADKDGNSKWITGETARKYVHVLRSRHNAVMVGIGTVLKDDPLLNVRHFKTEKQPFAIVVDPNLKIPAECRLLRERPQETIVLTSEKAEAEKRKFLERKGVTVLPLREEDGFLALEEFFKYSYQLNVYSILCEGGSVLASYLLERKLIDKLSVFFSGKLLGGEGFITPFKWAIQKPLRECYKYFLFKNTKLKEDSLLTFYREETYG